MDTYYKVSTSACGRDICIPLITLSLFWNLMWTIQVSRSHDHQHGTPRQEEMPDQPIRKLHWELLTNEKTGNALWGQHQQRDCDLCLHSSVVSNISSTLASHFRDAQKVCHHNFLFISAVIIDLESSPRPSPCLTWPRCRWGWGWSSHSSCHQWAHWSRQTPWLPPSRSTPGVSGWCSCSPGWLLSSPNAKHHQSKKHQFYFRGLKTLSILPISQKLWVR